MSVTQDPNELKKIIGVRTVAEVYRTLDKMAMRKEYHKALAENDISFNYLVQQLKNEMEGEKGSDRIKAIQIIMKSIGMDKYEEHEISGGSWEDQVIKKVEQEKGKPKAIEAKYEVKLPKVPESVQKNMAEEKKRAGDMYSDIYERSNNTSGRS